MAGHSKFKNIMHRKGAQDKKRAKIFSRLGREISVAVKEGGPDPEKNIRLRSAVGSAKSLNMPKDNIERAIKKGEGNDPDSNYEEVRYEGYGPEGVAIIVEALTNNKNRTAAEVRSTFSKYGGNLGETGSVSFGFKRLGSIIMNKSNINEEELFDFIESQVLPGLSVTSDQFWTGLSKLTHELGPKNRALLAERETMQAKIDQWHINNRGEKHDPVKYRAFLTEIDYIVAEPDEFEISTKNVDPEIASIPGPQLVVPIMNARYALNAANARWGSLYDAMYGTNAMGDLPLSAVYNAARGKRVVAWTKDYLDRVVPLAHGSHAKVDRYKIINDELAPALAYPEQYVGMNQNDKGELTEIFLQKNGLHIIIKVDARGKIGAVDTADVDDISLESAVSVIMDCEDSVAAVDAADKVLAYKNWLGLMRGDLKERVTKSDKTFDRLLNNDLFYTKSGKNLKLKGRALMLIRNVGHLMTIPAVIDRDGFEIGEGLLDAICTTLIAMHDRDQCKRNSLYGSIYVVKPKMHGPAEVAFADEIFTAVERMLGLAQNTVKLGIMDEERRTSVNLKACIYEAKHRVAFINTGFLDRTGDEIHTSMEAGPMVPKGQMKLSPWINAYEDRNVDIGLACGFQGKAQIGKGMWAMPDLMSEMLVQKVGHPKSGATCAWVPSPTAATLHATHYHEVDVLEVQRNIKANGPRWGLKELLTIPLAQGSNWSPDELMQEVENNAQGILGYVVRWVDNGIGCSKVPDIHDVGLMEDRATCRISSQALANWLHHGVIDREMVMAAMKKMASVVDGQNVDDPLYTPMAPSFDGTAFLAACDLVFDGRIQPSGYTEPVLHRRRLELKVSQT